MDVNVPLPVALMLSLVVGVVGNLLTPKVLPFIRWILRKNRETNAEALKRDIEAISRLHQNVYALSVYGWTQFFIVMSWIVTTIVGAGMIWALILLVGPQSTPPAAWAAAVAATLVLFGTVMFTASTFNLVVETTFNLLHLRDFDAWVARQTDQLRRMGISP